MQFLTNLKIDQNNAGNSTGSSWKTCTGEALQSFSPVDGKLIATVEITDQQAYENTINTALKAFEEWRMWPAPKRGDVVRQLGESLRQNKENLGQLVSYEMGKSLQE